MTGEEDYHTGNVPCMLQSELINCTNLAKENVEQSRTSNAVPKFSVKTLNECHLF